MDKIELLRALVTFYVVKLYNRINEVCYAHFGYSPRDGSAESAVKHEKDFSSCAKRYKILARSQIGFDGNVTCTPSSFALLHQSYEDPVQSVLKDDTVSLMGLTKEEAFFAVTPKNSNILEGPFIYAEQHSHAVELITISQHNFVRLAKEIANKLPRILLLSSTARCGSTLVTKMLEELDGVKTFSEPDFLTDVSMLGDEMAETVESVVEAGLKIQCKDARSSQLNIIKTRSVSVNLIPIISKACPDVAHAFMFRDPKGNIASIISMIRGYFNQKDFPEHLREMGPTMLRQLSIPGNEYENLIDELLRDLVRDFSQVRYANMFWAMHVLCYKACKSLSDADIFAFTYNGLIADPIKTVTNLLSHCSVEEANVEKCLKALAVDSQKKSTLSQEKLQKIGIKAKNFSRADIELIDSILVRCGLPTSKEYENLLQ